MSTTNCLPSAPRARARASACTKSRRVPLVSHATLCWRSCVGDADSKSHSVRTPSHVAQSAKRSPSMLKSSIRLSSHPHCTPVTAATSAQVFVLELRPMRVPTYLPPRSTNESKNSCSAAPIAASIALRTASNEQESVGIVGRTQPSSSSPRRITKTCNPAPSAGACVGATKVVTRARSRASIADSEAARLSSVASTNTVAEFASTNAWAMTIGIANDRIAQGRERREKSLLVRLRACAAMVLAEEV